MENKVKQKLILTDEMRCLVLDDLKYRLSLDPGDEARIGPDEFMQEIGYGPRDAITLNDIRYKWLRHGDNDELIIQRGPVDPTYYWLPRNERLDQMIDEHIRRQDMSEEQ